MPEAPSVEEKAAEPVAPYIKTHEERANDLIANVMVTNMLKSSEESKLALTMNVKSLKDEITQQKADQTDMYYYLNKKCDDSFEVISSLEEQLLSEQSDREVSEKMYENKVEHLTRELSDEKNTLNTKISKLEKELEGVQKFVVLKGSMEREIADLKRGLEKERFNCKSVVADMEQQWTLERNRLRKASEQAVLDVRAEYDHGLRDRLEDKTREVMARNEEIERELHFQSAQADKVLEYNQRVLDGDSDIRRKLELSQEMEAELMEKLTVYQRTIKKQNTSISTLQNECEKEKKACAKKDKELQAYLLKSTQVAKADSEGKTLFDELWVYLVAEFKAMSVASAAVGGNDDVYDSAQAARVLSLGKTKREEEFLAMMRSLILKFPELQRLFGGGAVAAADPTLSPKNNNNNGAGRLSIFPAMSPHGKQGGSISKKGALGSGAGRRAGERAFFNTTLNIATQTDESSLLDSAAANEESLWLTDIAPKRERDFPSPGMGSVGGQSSLSYYEQNDRSASPVGSYGSGMIGGGGSSSAVEHELSVKSTSAVPPSHSSPSGSKMKYGSMHRPRMQGISSLKGAGAGAGVPSSGASVGSSHSGGNRTVPVDMRMYVNNGRSNGSGGFTKISGITGQKKAIVNNSGSGGLDVKGMSPQSSVSMSPRGGSSLDDDNSTIFTASPRGQDMDDLL